MDGEHERKREEEEEEEMKGRRREHTESVFQKHCRKVLGFKNIHEDLTAKNPFAVQC